MIDEKSDESSNDTFIGNSVDHERMSQNYEKKSSKIK
jgi:hypothetical protein